MGTLLNGYRVHFPDYYDERDEWEREMKGWMRDIQVEFEDGSHYPLFFYEPVRLAQDLEAHVAGGYGTVIAEPGLVVVPKVTRAVILRAVEELIRDGYFEHLRPLNGR